MGTQTSGTVGRQFFPAENRRWLMTWVSTLVVGGSACVQQTPETLLVDLRLVAAVVDPPELQPGADMAVTWEVVDGQRTDSRPLSWIFVACSRIEGLGDCLEFGDLLTNPQWVTADQQPTEEGYREYLRRYSQVGEMQQGSLVLQQFTAYSLQFLLTDAGESPPPTEEGSTQELPLFSELTGEVRLLVCGNDACADLQEELSNVLDGLPISRSVASLYKELTSSAVLEDRDPAQTALALKHYRLSRRPVGERNTNPLVTGLVLSEAGLTEGDSGSSLDPQEVLAAATLKLTLELSTTSYQDYFELDENGSPVPRQEELEVRWYSTQGSPVAPPRELPDGPPFLEGEDTSPTPLPSQFEAYFELPIVGQTPLPALFYAVVVDPRGGSAYLSRAVEIR